MTLCGAAPGYLVASRTLAMIGTLSAAPDKPKFGYHTSNALTSMPHALTSMPAQHRTCSYRGSDHRHPAIDMNGLPCDIAGLLRGEIDGRRSDIGSSP